MSLKQDHPEHSSFEALIRRAQVERSVYLACAIAGALAATWNFIKRLVAEVPIARSPHNRPRDSMLKRFAPRR